MLRSTRKIVILPAGSGFACRPPNETTAPGRLLVQPRGNYRVTDVPQRRPHADGHHLVPRRRTVHRPVRVDSGRGQNRTLRPLSALWPPVFAGEQDLGQELGLDGQTGVFPLSDRFAEMGGIPVNDDGGE